jgi:uncharacterized Fe-S radical SAM superfamily protein PflX
MVKLAGKPVFDNDGIMKSGVIVRHLVCRAASGTQEQCSGAARDFGSSIYISIMVQYTPPPRPGCDFPHEGFERLSTRASSTMPLTLH